MVAGRMTLRKATVVDLDGTYVFRNTLKMFLRIGFTDLLRRGCIGRAIAVAALVAARKARFIKHETMKYKSIGLIGVTPKIKSAMQLAVESSIDSNVKSILEERKSQGDLILMASAAPGFYIRWFWNGHLVASPDCGPDCKSEAKLDAVKTWLHANGAAIGMVITDHYDDLPLARYASQNEAEIIIVSPNEKTVKTLKQAGLKYRLIYHSTINLQNHQKKQDA